eukprot:2799507-Lingulodinium_polyedra.AAC.1
MSPACGGALQPAPILGSTAPAPSPNAGAGPELGTFGRCRARSPMWSFRPEKFGGNERWSLRRGSKRTQ